MKIELELDKKLDFEVYLIKTQLPDYRLAFMLNAAMSLQLKRNINKRSYSNKYDSYVPYLSFGYEDYQTEESFQLIENKSSIMDNDIEYNENILPTLPEIDFILIVDKCYRFDSIKNLLKEMSFISFANHSTSREIKLILN